MEEIPAQEADLIVQRMEYFGALREPVISPPPSPPIVEELPKGVEIWI
jgi:hypothetical protein